MQTITFTIPSGADNHILHGRIWMPETPRAVVALVHGMGEHCGRYAPMAKALAANGIAITALDLQGHGLTRGPRGLVKNADVMLGDIDALIRKTRERFAGIPLILMGHSMGGGLVLKYSLDKTALDIKGVIAQAPLIKPAKPVPGPLQSILRLIYKIAPNFRVKSQFKGSDISTLADEALLYENDPLNHGYLGVGLGLSLFSTGDEVAASASKFSYSVLLTHGTGDVLTDFDASKDFAQDAPNATFISYEHSAHEIHNDLHRQQVYMDILGWIDARV